MVWTHEDTQNTNKNNLTTIEGNKIDKYCRHSHKLHNPTISKTSHTCDLNNKDHLISTISSTGSTGEIHYVHRKVSETSNNLLHNEETKKENVHLIQAEIHNEKSNSAVKSCDYQYNIQSSDNSIVDDENVIITNEVLKENVDCNNFDESCHYNFNYKRHGKNKVNMLVHRHTL